MIEKHDVTVIIPTFNHEPYIESTIDSVRRQTETGLRMLVVDDCSTDGTVDRARRIEDPRLVVTANRTNLGLGDTVLGALESVTSPFVALLNSDDLFHAERLARTLDVMRRQDRIQVVATAVEPIDDRGRSLTAGGAGAEPQPDSIRQWLRWFANRPQPSADDDCFATLLECNFLVTSSNIVCRTSFLRQSRHALAGLKFCLDWQIFLDAAARNALACLSEPLLQYRLHGANTIWFDGGGRWTYLLEVNSVLASAVCGDLPSSVRGRRSTLELLRHHALKHQDARRLLLYPSVAARAAWHALGRGAPPHRSRT